MEICFKCREPETRALLFDAVSSSGIVKVCGKCSSSERIPIIKEPIPPQEEYKPLRERLVKISGIETEKPSISPEEKDELRELVNANYVFKENVELKENMVDNFHWVIQRGRRMRHITQGQLAMEIHEPEEVIKKIEQGHVPAKIDVVRKIEKALGIIIRKEIKEEKLEFSKEDFNLRNFNHMTIADLNELRTNKELEMLEEEIEMLNLEKDEEDYRRS